MGGLLPRTAARRDLSGCVTTAERQRSLSSPRDSTVAPSPASTMLALIKRFSPARESSRTSSAALATATQYLYFRAILALVLRRLVAWPNGYARCSPTGFCGVFNGPSDGVCCVVWLEWSGPAYARTIPDEVEFARSIFRWLGSR